MKGIDMGLFDGTALERPVTCERCDEPLATCGCPKSASGFVCLPADQHARVRREKRRGKWVTVVSGLDAHASDLPALAKQAKKRWAGGGGTTGDGFDIQGDHRDAAVAWLKSLGYPAKAAGG
ncbi:MAG: translation initiation factor [Planctomycetota bacterium]